MSAQPTATATTPGRHQIVVIGSGFGALNAAQKLKRADADITLIARTNQHLFQPLLYQVATGILSSGEIAPATRLILRRQHNVEVVLGEVTHIDLANKRVISELVDHTYATPFDTLVVAAGAGQSYFGNDHFAQYAPGMKSIDDALELRARILGSFEMAERSTDQARRERLLTFVVVGAGPTGVEMAGQIAEMAQHTLKGSFRNIDSSSARVILLDGSPAVLPAMGEKLGKKAKARLEKLGIEVQLGATVTGVDRTGVTVRDTDGTERHIFSTCKVWSAGVKASELGRDLAEQSGVALDRAGRVQVLPDLSIPGYPNVFVVGDMAAVPGVPGVAQGAIQEGRYVGKLINAELRGASPEQREPFTFFDKGSMATVSRFSALAKIGPLEFSGFTAWLAWLFLHLFYLVGFKTKVSTLLSWAVTFLSTSRGQLAITEQQAFARNRIRELADIDPDLVDGESLAAMSLKPDSAASVNKAAS